MRSDRPNRGRSARRPLGGFEQLEARIVLAVAVSDPDANDFFGYLETNQNSPLVVDNVGQRSITQNDTLDAGSAALVDTPPSHGALSNFNGTAGTFTYTPTPNFYGTDSFTYRLSGATQATTLFHRTDIRTTANPPVPTNMGETWKYLSLVTNAAYPAANWNTEAFSDTAWSSGRAILGYGTLDGSAETNGTAIVGAGFGTTVGNAAASTTSLYRKTFDLGAISAISVTMLHFVTLCEDGCVFYLNGREVGRPGNRVSANPVLSTSVSAGPGSETMYDVTNVAPPAGVLHNGVNLIAVEVHQAASTSTDLGMDMNFSIDYTTQISNAATVTLLVDDGNIAPVAVGGETYTVAEDSSLDTLAAGRPSLIANEGTISDPTTVSVDTAGTEGTVVVDANTGHFVFTPAANFSGLTSFRYTLTDDDGVSNTATALITVTPVADLPTANDDPATPGLYDVPKNAQVSFDEISSLTLVQPATLNAGAVVAGASWSYFHPTDGTNPAIADADFNSTWYTREMPTTTYNGPAFSAPVPSSLGYGALDWATAPGIISGIGAAGSLTAPASGSRFSAYFTSTFDLASAASVKSLDATYLFDDGAFIYLNGHLVRGVNMAATAVDTYNQFAANATNTEAAMQSVNLSAGIPYLQNGTNYLAISLHNSAADSSDLGLNFGLNAIVENTGVLGNDFDPDFDVLTAHLVTGPQHGSLALAANGTFTYTPVCNFTGSDTFTYRVDDRTPAVPPGNSNLATVTLTVVDTGGPSVACDDAYNGFEDEALSVSAANGVLANENGAATGLQVDLTSVTQPAGGSLNIQANGAFTFTPTANFNGQTTFRYANKDATNNVSNLATVTIDVASLPDPPTVVTDNYNTTENSPLVVAAPGPLANDSLPADETGTLGFRLVSQPAGGSVTVAAGVLDGSFTYTPLPNFNGSDSFTYAAIGNSATLVGRGGSPPTAVPAGASTWRFLDDGSDQGTAWRDPGFNDLTWNSGLGELGYGDGAGDGDERTLVNDLVDTDPVAAGVQHPATVYFRTHFTAHATANVVGLRALVRRDDGVAVYLNGHRIVLDNVAADAAYNVFALADAGSETTFFETVSFSPADLAFLHDGDNVLAAEVHQVNAGSSDISFDMDLLAMYGTTGTVNVTVAPLNDNPEAVDDSFTVNEQTALSGNVLTNEGIGSGETYTISLIGAPPAHAASFNLGANGTFSYTSRAIPNLAGAADTFQYQITDQLNRTSNVATATINVTAVNSPPVGNADSYQTPAGQTLTTTLVTTRLLAGSNGTTPGATWRYFDADTLNPTGVDWSSDLAALGAPDWRSAAFNPDDPDTFGGALLPVWKSGTSEFGYDVPADADDETVVLGGTPAGAIPTYYFRTTFNNPGGVQNLIVTADFDDGMAVYLNGVEVIRDNLAPNPTHTTQALGGATDPNNVHTYLLPASVLVAGMNVIAAEVHQSGTGSSDMSFDLQIDAITHNDGVLANDQENDGTVPTVALVSPPTHHDATGGAFALAPTGTFSYTPQAGFSGTDTFTYNITDGTTSVGPVTVSINVQGGFLVGDMPDPALGGARDGRVNLRDMALFLANFGKGNATVDMGDFNGDQKVGVRDLVMLRDNLGMGGPSPAASAPASLVAQAGAIGEQVQDAVDHLLSDVDRIRTLVHDTAESGNLGARLTARIRQVRDAVEQATQNVDLSEVRQTVRSALRAHRSRAIDRVHGLANAVRQAADDWFAAHEG